MLSFVIQLLAVGIMVEIALILNDARKNGKS
jgi:hypothetical protein